MKTMLMLFLLAAATLLTSCQSTMVAHLRPHHEDPSFRNASFESRPILRAHET